MKKPATKAPKKTEKEVTDLTPKKEQDVNGGFSFVMKVNKPSPTL